MKKLVASLVVAFIMVIAAGANAQVPTKPVDLYLGGGLTIPTASLADQQNPGFNGHGRVVFNLPGVVNLQAGADFHQLPFDDGGEDGFDGGDARILMIAGGVRYEIDLPASPIVPAMEFESGLALFSVTDLTLPTDEIQQFENREELFISFGVGVDINRFFAKARYVNIFTDGDDETMIPFTVGVKF